jgi:hypothetical protein
LRDRHPSGAIRHDATKPVADLVLAVGEWECVGGPVGREVEVGDGVGIVGPCRSDLDRRRRVAVGHRRIVCHQPIWR